MEIFINKIFFENRRMGEKCFFFSSYQLENLNLFISKFLEEKKKLSIFKFMRKLNFFDYVCNFLFIRIRKLNKIRTYHSSQVPQLVLKEKKII